MLWIRKYRHRSILQPLLQWLTRSRMRTPRTIQPQLSGTFPIKWVRTFELTTGSEVKKRWTRHERNPAGISTNFLQEFPFLARPVNAILQPAEAELTSQKRDRNIFFRIRKSTAHQSAQALFLDNSHN